MAGRTPALWGRELTQRFADEKPAMGAPSIRNTGDPYDMPCSA